LFTARLVIAVVSTFFEELALVAVWRWLLPEFDISVPLSALIVVMVAWGIFSVTLFIFTTRTLRRQAMVGLPTMIGSKGRVVSPLRPEGQVRIKGELWGATSLGGDAIPANEEVVVVGEDGLKLIVRPGGSDKPPQESGSSGETTH